MEISPGFIFGKSPIASLTVTNSLGNKSSAGNEKLFFDATIIALYLACGTPKDAELNIASPKKITLSMTIQFDANVDVKRVQSILEAIQNIIPNEYTLKISDELEELIESLEDEQVLKLKAA